MEPLSEGWRKGFVRGTEHLGIYFNLSGLLGDSPSACFHALISKGKKDFSGHEEKKLLSR
jgi:hypothetical protein